MNKTPAIAFSLLVFVLLLSPSMVGGSADITEVEYPEKVSPGEEFSVTDVIQHDFSVETQVANEIFYAEDVPEGEQVPLTATALSEKTLSLTGKGTVSVTHTLTAPSEETTMRLVKTLWIHDGTTWNENISARKSLDIKVETPRPWFAEPFNIAIIVLIMTGLVLTGWKVRGKIGGKPEDPCAKLRRAVRAAEGDLKAKKMTATAAGKDLEKAEPGSKEAWKKFRASNLTKKNLGDPKTITLTGNERKGIKKSVDRQIKKEVAQAQNLYGREVRKSVDDFDSDKITAEQHEQRTERLSKIHSKKADQIKSDGYRKELMKKRHDEILGKKKRVAEKTGDAVRAYNRAKEKAEKSASEVAEAKAKLDKLKKELKECEEKAKKAEKEAKKKKMISNAAKKRDAARKAVKDLEAHIRDRGARVRKFKDWIKRSKMNDPLYIKRQWELYKHTTGEKSGFSSRYAPKFIEATLSEIPSRNYGMLKAQFAHAVRIKNQILINKVFPRIHDLGGILLAAVPAPSMKSSLIQQACAPVALYIKDQVLNEFSSKFGQDLSKTKKFDLKQNRWLRSRIEKTRDRLNNEIRVLGKELRKQRAALRSAGEELRKTRKDC